MASLPLVRSIACVSLWTEDPPIGFASVELALSVALRPEADLVIQAAYAECRPRTDNGSENRVFDDSAVLVDFDRVTGDLRGLELLAPNVVGGPTFEEFSAYLTQGGDVRAGSLMLHLNRLWLAVDVVLHEHSVVLSGMLEREPFPEAEVLLWMNRFLAVNDAAAPLRPKVRLTSIRCNRPPA